MKEELEDYIDNRIDLLEKKLVELLSNKNNAIDLSRLRIDVARDQTSPYSRVRIFDPITNSTVEHMVYVY